MRQTRSAFTLFEVVISLLLVTIAVTTILMLLPMGVKAQQMSRYQLYASVKANEFIESYSQCIADFNVNQDHNAFQLDANWPYNDGAGPQGGDLVAKSIYGNLGHYDLERIVVNANEGNYPIPLEIARRLDSPGDEIQRVLDLGAHIYYSDPFPGKNATRGMNTLGALPETSGDLQRLVWTVAGYAQQNALPMDPLEQPHEEMWPFPPSGRGRTIPRYYCVGWRAELLTPGLATGRFQNVVPAAMAAVPIQTWNSGQKWNGSSVLYHASTWEMYARQEREKGLPGIWNAGVHEFRRLSYMHWGRIMHQLRGYGERAPELVTQAPPGVMLPLKFVGGRFLPDGTYQNVWAYMDGLDNVVAQRWPSGMPYAQPQKGIPAPANGLPMSRYRGTDILYEDQETWNNTNADSSQGFFGQIRLGMPSLQRRVMYRTAALSLWAKVQGTNGVVPVSSPIELHKAPAGNLNLDPAADPNVADLIAALPPAQNPLLNIIDPPANPAQIHPAQVLALGYIAHAAMMVTGYRPPFVDTHWNNDAADDDDVQPSDTTLPFRDLEAADSYLFDLWQNPLKPVESPQATPPGFVGQAYSGSVALTIADFSSKPERFEVDSGTTPSYITYHRMTGPILNPNPPPYADTYSFDVAGACSPTAWNESNPTGTTIRRTWAGNGWASGGPTDTQMARNAHETFMRWAMAYISENPYDFIVPRPMNRQTMIDQPLFAFDMFDSSGNAAPFVKPGQGQAPGMARRPLGDMYKSITNYTIWVDPQYGKTPFYPTMWGGHRLLPNFYYLYGGTDDSYMEWCVERARFHGVPADPGYSGNGDWWNRTGFFNWDDGASGPGKTDAIWPIEWGAPYYVNNVGPASRGIEPGVRTWALGEVCSHQDGFGGATNSTGIVSTRYGPNYGWMVFARNRLHGQDLPPASGNWWESGESIYSKGMDIVKSENPEHNARYWFNDPFKPADRCRQIVFWAVDWKSFEDAESAPSAPQEWTSHGRANSNNWDCGRLASWSSLGTLIGNPEQDFVWMTPEHDGTMSHPSAYAVDRQFPTAWGIPGVGNYRGPGDVFDSRHPGVFYSRSQLYAYTKIEKSNPYYAVGAFGADRNHNGKYDIGKVPATSRMRAAEVARFNYYDPIAWTSLRK
ncbi:MAG: hypothetical protein H0W83_00655 [Planctomycetes bacterium]|nr:hypothetical protein [Planctomycetota bacterium]